MFGKQEIRHKIVRRMQGVEASQVDRNPIIKAMCRLMCGLCVNGGKYDLKIPH